MSTSSWGGVARLQELCSAEFFCPCSLDVFLVFELYHVPYNVCALGGSWEMTFSSSCPLFHLALSIVMAIQVPTSSFLSSRIPNSVCVLALSLPMLLKAPWSKEMGMVVKVKQLELSYLNRVLGPYLTARFPALNSPAAFLFVCFCSA